MDPKQLLILPIEAQSRFERAAEENQRLSNVLAASNVIFGELDKTFLGEEGAKQLKAVEEEIALVDKQLSSAQAVLMNSLSQSNSQVDASETGAILKLILSKLQRTLDTLVISSATQGSLSVPFMTMVDIEDQISKIIEDLHDRGLFPERPEQSEKRMKDTEEHMSRVLVFVKALLAAHAQANSE